MINFCALRYIKKAKMPAIKGDVIQLEAISPTLDHDTASIPLVITTKPTIAPTIE